MPPSKNCPERRNLRRLAGVIVRRRPSATFERTGAPLRNRVSAETGTASLEFITAGVILLLPIVYLIITLASIQAGGFAVEGAARQAARVFIDSPDARTGEEAARRAVAFALDDYGIDPAIGELEITCTPNPADCLTRNALVTASVRLSVTLPLVPQALTVSAPIAIPLSASASLRVSRFEGAH